MNTESIVETVVELVKNGQGAVVIGAVICFVLTAIVKRFCNKTVTDLTHSFDVCVVAPFLFGLIISALSVFLIGGQRGVTAVISALEQGIAMGAVATAIYRLWQSIDKSSLKQLLKDDLFKLFYDQLSEFTEIPQKLINGETTIKEFIGEVQTLCAGAKKIYSDSQSEKAEELSKLMKGIFDDNTVETLLPQLNLALEKFFKTNVRS